MRKKYVDFQILNKIINYAEKFVFNILNSWFSKYCIFFQNSKIKYIKSYKEPVKLVLQFLTNFNKM